MIILSIGTNIGDRERNIENAVKALGEIGKVTAISPIYTSEPWGFESENGFYNIALTMESKLLPLDLLQETQRIEKELGRTAKTTTEYADRVIDIDIIAYGQTIIETTELTIPHRLMHIRNFVLYPLADIAPSWMHPMLHLTAHELKNQCPDTSIINILHH